MTEVSGAIEERATKTGLTFIEGKKTILFPFEVTDMDFFYECLKENTNNIFVFNLKEKTKEQVASEIVWKINNNQLAIFACWTKQGKGARPIGFIYITDFNGWKLNVHGMISKQFLKDIVQQMEEKYTYTEDGYHTFLKHCFNILNLVKVETIITRENRLAWKIDKKVGFKVDGVLRKQLKDGNGNFHDLVIMSILKEEYNPPVGGSTQEGKK